MEALTLTPQMTALANRLKKAPRRAYAANGPRERAQRLYHAILDGELKVRYNEDVDAGWRPRGCKSARSVFEEIGPQGERFAMCLEYTLLFVALGRAMGLDVAGMRSDQVLGVGEQFVYGHIVAAVREAEGWHVVDLANRRFWRDAEGHTLLGDHMLEAYYLNNSGLIFRAQGRLRDAEEAISAALSLEGGYGAFWYNRGCVRLLQGKPRRARADLDRAAKLQPRDANILTNLAVAQNRMGERANARMTLYLARQEAPGDARIAYNLGCLAYEEEEYETAAVHWRDALSLDPWNGQARRSLGHLLRALGESDEGLRVLAGLA